MKILSKVLIYTLVDPSGVLVMLDVMLTFTLFLEDITVSSLMEIQQKMTDKLSRPLKKTSSGKKVNCFCVHNLHGY